MNLNLPALSELEAINPTPAKDSCKGLIYRGRVSVFRTKKGIAVKKEVTLLKKKSCPGCSSCYGLEDQVAEFMDGEYDFGINEIEDGKLYALRVTDAHTDWESGMVDEWDLTFVEVPE